MFYIITCNFPFVPILVAGRSEVWVCGRSLAEILGSNSARAWLSVCCKCCVESGRGVCDELITRPDKSYCLWCVVVCQLETSRMKKPWPALGCSAKKNCFSLYIFTLKLIFTPEFTRLYMYIVLTSYYQNVSHGLGLASFPPAISHVYEFFQGSIFSICSHNLKPPT